VSNGAGGRSDRMQDLGIVVLVLAFFALSLAFVRLCERLR
jgi:hypothetical protein